jgi:Rrf2 family protein
MKISTRARYGVRLMATLAENYGKEPIFLKDIAHRENISEKYLSLIVIPLRGANLVNSVRGAQGGYNLSRDPSQISLREVVDVLEGSCSLVDCVKNPSLCDRASICAAHDIWALVGERISETLSSITLERLLEMNREKERNTLTGGFDPQRHGVFVGWETV